MLILSKFINSCKITKRTS